MQTLDTNNYIYEVEITSMANGGAGIGKIDNLAVFVDGAVTGDIVRVKTFSKNKSFYKAQLLEVIKPSPSRVKPICALHNVCGGCQWQFIDYDYQLEAKQNIVKDCFKKIAGVDFDVKSTVASPKTTEYRCKIQLPVSQTKNSKRILSGYYQKGSHELVNIKFCPIQPKIINIITEFIKKRAQELQLSGYAEKTHKGLLRHFVFRYSLEENVLVLVFVINAKDILPALKRLAKDTMKEFAQVKGVLANFNTDKSNLIMTEDFALINGDDFVKEKLSDKIYKISAGSFFQVNPSTASNIVDFIKDKVDNVQSLLDVYCGAGAFSIALSGKAQNITGIEYSKSAIEDAKENLKLNSVDNVEFLQGDAQVILESLAEQGRSFETAVVDPPRKGCSDETLTTLIKLVKKQLIYVSCDPSTLARDVKFLLANGFELKEIQPFDMFPHTYHVETIAILNKTN
ncbi:MAG: 23S rRNA (uracil(1939)-C(5))-methyltransferase RlmD [Candidatus Gastranaerophilales bacterium]|nr:23S rRNA (uracil(1939)-C(5))-methyltransferase RlmD [Candidatus Gastranaerophilales bacterium]